MSNIVINFSAVGEKQDISTIEGNMESWYPEFEQDTKVSNYDGENINITFSGKWNGDIEEAIKLTHHAEALYDNTKCEYVHVEVTVDGKQYGSTSSIF